MHNWGWNSVDDFRMFNAAGFSQDAVADKNATKAFCETAARMVLLDHGI